VIEVDGHTHRVCRDCHDHHDSNMKWPSGSIEVRDLYVAPSYRGTSMAPRALLEAMSKHTPPAWCFFVYAGNRDSTKLIKRHFTRLGYTPRVMQSTWEGCPGTLLRLDPP
jgi:GNAT superfamily N-acetyltransferase